MTDFALIGNPLGHSFSPKIQDLLGISNYKLLPLEEEELDAFLNQKKFKGLNVTIPYKKKVIKYLDRLEDKAKQTSVVNTIINKSNILTGYNTDYYGLKAMLEKSGQTFNNSKFLITGPGATGQTAASLLRDMGAEEIVFASRRPSDGQLSYEEASKKKDINYIINTSPLGMYPDLIDKLAIVPAAFPDLKGVFDAVYNPLKSRLIQRAESLGLIAYSGLYMLILQAYYSSKLFMGYDLDEIEIDEAIDRSDSIYRKISFDKENIVLIGMPSSGKSSLAKSLAKKLKRPLYEMDKLIEQGYNKTIADIFKDEGEDTFRDYESKLAKELRPVQGAVISTGGGIILKRKNIEYLKANGRLFFLDRPLNELRADQSRPTASNNSALEDLYNKRHDLYLKYADKVIKDFSSIENTMQAILDYYLFN